MPLENICLWKSHQERGFILSPEYNQKCAACDGRNTNPKCEYLTIREIQITVISIYKLGQKKIEERYPDDYVS